MKFTWDECNGISLMNKSTLIKVIRWHRTITWVNVDPDLCRNMALLGSNWARIYFSNWYDLIPISTHLVKFNCLIIFFVRWLLAKALFIQESANANDICTCRHVYDPWQNIGAIDNVSSSRDGSVFAVCVISDVVTTTSGVSLDNHVMYSLIGNPVCYNAMT